MLFSGTEIPHARVLLNYTSTTNTSVWAMGDILHSIDRSPVHSLPLHSGIPQQ